MTPGYKTTEFWLSLVAMILGAVAASGAIVEGSMAAQIIGGVMAILAQLGYTASRTQVKKAAEKVEPEIVQ
jgi:hypothetical protein